MGSWCDTCKEYKFNNGHKCPPVWKTLIPGYDGEEWVDVYANNPEQAARKRAEEHDAEDYNLLEGDEITILVKDLQGVVIIYTCGGAPTPEYWAVKK